MSKEELKQLIDELMEYRFSLVEKLSHIDNLTIEEKKNLYNSFKENSQLLVQAEHELSKLEFQEWWSFIEQCSKELIKLKQ